MKKAFAATMFCAILLVGTNAWAHTFWVNLTESMGHSPGHVTTILGFGHTPPIDDLLVGEHGAIRIGKYALVGPDGKFFDLGPIDPTPIPSKMALGSLKVEQGDLGLRKISVSKDTAPGSYQVVAESVPMFLTMYKDKKGRQRMAPKPMNKVKDMAEVVESFRYQSYAKSFFGVQEWSEPKPMGHILEVMPLTDMSDIHVGDLVRFKVTFKGKAVNASSSNLVTMACFSNTFGAPDGFQLNAYVMGGEVQFRMPSAGQWVANVLYEEKVADNPAVKEYEGMCTKVFTGGSVGFTVKP